MSDATGFPMYTVKQAAAMTGCSVSAINRAVCRGRLATVPGTDGRMISLEALEEYASRPTYKGMPLATPERMAIVMRVCAGIVRRHVWATEFERMLADMLDGYADRIGGA